MIEEYLNKGYMNIREQRKIAKWLIEGDTGQSSLGMMAFFMGYSHEANNPHDPSDLRRCYEFLKCIDPTNQGNLVLKMAGLSKKWMAIAKNWNKLEALYKKECKQGRAPELFELMQELGL